MSDNPRADVEKLIREVAELRDELASIQRCLEKEFPDLLARREEIQKELPVLLNQIKEKARSLGPGNIDVGPHRVQVRRPPIKRKIDVEGLLEEAESRGDLFDLLDAEVLTYTVQQHMIERLPGEKKAVYARFIEEYEGTSSVVLPKHFK